MKYLIYNNNVNKKEEEIISLYKELLNKNNNKSKNILVLIQGNNSKVSYERSLKLKYSEGLSIYTYLSFIKKEIIKFWPIITSKCSEIKSKYASPVFISSSLSEYILIKDVENVRNTKGYFADIISTNKNIAKSINNNIYKASLSLIEFDNISDKIYSSKKNRDTLERFSYSEMNEVVLNYINALLKYGVLDNSLSVYLFNEYLLTDDRYLNYLNKEYDYVIVDSLDNSSNAEVNLINEIDNLNKDIYMFFNKSRDYSVFNNIDMKYIYENIIKKSKTYRNECDKEDILLSDLYTLETNIYLDEDSQVYNEMIDKVCEKVDILLKNGYLSKDIAIIAPINNSILEYDIKNNLKKYEIDIVSTKKDKKIYEYKHISALFTCISIFYEYEEIISEDEYINLIQVMLKKNKIQSLIIYQNKDLNEEYINLINYIKDKSKENLKIDELIIRIYVEKILNLEDGKNHIDVLKKLIQMSEEYTQIINMLGFDKYKSSEKIFIDIIKTNINDYYISSQVKDIIESNEVIMTTPYSYISNNIQRKVQLWLDVGSNTWNMKIEKDISNLIVLRKSYEEGTIYDDLMEEKYKRYYLYNTIYNLMINAKEVYAYKSEYSINGYIQESRLYSMLSSLTNKGDYTYE